jgi:hypothetical protein
LAGCVFCFFCGDSSSTFSSSDRTIGCLEGTDNKINFQYPWRRKRYCKRHKLSDWREYTYLVLLALFFCD